ncbi:MAG: hypothetical protein OCC49_18950 [Fibrobacterales bacterium]
MNIKNLMFFVLFSIATTFAGYTWTQTTRPVMIQGDWYGTGLYIQTENGHNVFLKHSDFDSKMLNVYHTMLLMAQSGQINLTIQYRTDVTTSYSPYGVVLPFGHIKQIRSMNIN